MISKVYCAAPFVSRSHSPDGTLKPCCDWNSALDDDGVTLDEQGMQKLRETMLNGKPSDGCRSCYAAEEAGVESTRMNFNWMYGHTTDVVLRHLDFSLGNLCNFKCRMCNSGSSSKWAADAISMGLDAKPLYRRKARELESYDLSSLDMIKFKGGETLFEQETMFEVLSMVENQLGDLSRLTVQFNTNGSQEISQDLLGMLTSCGTVYMTVSVDGVGKINDYQRTGANWDIMEKNLINWASTLPDSVKLSLYSVWGLLNIHGAIELIEWAHDTIPRYMHFGTALKTPSALCIRNIPAGMKEIYLRSLTEWTRLDHIFEVEQHKKMMIGELAREPNLSSADVLDHINTLDRLRRESFKLINPQLYDSLTAGDHE